MSASSNNKKNQKHKNFQRSKKTKTKNKVEIRKSQVSNEYQEVENEVRVLLDNVQIGINRGNVIQGYNSSTESLNIFCSANNLNQIIDDCSPRTGDIDDSRENNSENSISSFIQIIPDDDIITIDRVKPKFQLDSNLIYLPETRISAISGARNYRTNTSKDRELYRTFCDHKFRPIFLQPSPESIQIPCRKLITLHLYELRFTEHPVMLEEHRICNTLNDMYNAYVERHVARICEHILEELQCERKIVNRLLSAQCKDVEKLEESLNKVQTLRNKLCTEEIQNKKMLQQILDTWIKLKNIRKSQKIRCTRFKIQIRMKEIADLEDDNRRWMKRFECELNEIYREELQAYYRAKRMWKTSTEKENYSPTPKPRKPNIEKINSQLRNKLSECTRLPGEPIIEINRNDFKENDEVIELKNFDKLKTYFLRIFLDQQFVGATRAYRLESDLSFSIDETIGILLERRMPKEIKISIYEKTHIPGAPVKLANILTNLPHRQSEDHSRNLKTLHFTSHKQPISGRLILRCQSDEDTYMDYMSKLASPQSTFNSNTTIDNIESTPDPVKDDSCTFEEDLHLFCNLEDLESNRRFKLLSSRYRCIDGRTQNLRGIPAFDKELNIEFEDENEKNPHGGKNYVLEAGNWMDPIDLYKHNGKKYIRHLYEILQNHCSRLERVYENRNDLLIGGSEPITFVSFLQAMGGIFSQKKNLLLTPKDNNFEIIPSKVSFGDFKIVVNVVRATGIPIRSFSRTETDEDVFYNFPPHNFQYSNVRPYISVSYKDKSVRTMTADGSNPTWNEQLVLQMSSGNLNEYHDDVKILLFDECIECHANDENLVRNQKIQSNWLGEYRIPIGALLSRSKIEGVFEMSIPKILLGYNPPYLDLPKEGGTNMISEQLPEIKNTVHVWLYVCIEPSYQMPRSNTTNLECSELNEVRTNLNEWCLEAKELATGRFVDPLICTVDGKRICLTRLLEAIPLPIHTSDNLVDHVCRFVSMFNILRNYEPCMGFSGVWLNNQIILDTTWTSPKDLGILLANFFLTIGIPCWVVLGEANPYGESAFVLYRQNESDYTFVDPTSGKKYSNRDIFCPMTKIFYIFNQANIYCNIQSETRVSMTNLNLNENSCWLPAFNRKNPSPLGGVQKLNYLYRNSFDCRDLRKNIERKIVKKINSWRSMKKTIWNRAFQTKMENVLAQLENTTIFDNSTEDVNFSKTSNEEFFSSFPNYKIYGFTLNFSYNNLSSISERIRSTGIHLNSDKKVEFCTAVHLHSHPNNIFSVWIFLISLIPPSR